MHNRITKQQMTPMVISTYGGIAAGIQPDSRISSSSVARWRINDKRKVDQLNKMQDFCWQSSAVMVILLIYICKRLLHVFRDCRLCAVYWEQSALHVYILINSHHFTIKWVYFITFLSNFYKPYIIWMPK